MDGSYELEIMADEHIYSDYICGVDEVGRGPLSGPVVAAAVVLNDFNIEGLNDSKKLTERQRRDVLVQLVASNSIMSVSFIYPQTIDEINILQASLLAMKEAVLGLGVVPGVILVDGNQQINMDTYQRTVVGGDAKVASIAAASVVAKLARDDYMNKLHKKYPEFDWINNKGYGTKAHIDAINNFGITDHHRKSFAPVKNMIKDGAIKTYRT